MRTCAADGCTNAVAPGTRGRPAIYCCPQCRPGRRLRQGPVVVELDHPAASPDGRPTERVWAVRLRRGELVVEIADGLGWPSATALARAIEHLLRAPAPVPGQVTR